MGAFLHAGGNDGPLPQPIATLNLASLQEWTIGPINTTKGGDGGLSYHPFHLHVTPYQLQNLSKESSYFRNGDWHDVFMSNQLNGKFLTVRFQLSSFTGRYVVHCHILEHDDHGMMNYVEV